MHKHFVNIKNDPNVSSAHIYGAVQTRLLPTESTDIYHLPNHTLYRNDYPHDHSTQRSPYGLAVYSKIPVTDISHSNFDRNQVTMLKAYDLKQQLQLMFVYRSPAPSNAVSNLIALLM